MSKESVTLKWNRLIHPALALLSAAQFYRGQMSRLSLVIILLSLVTWLHHPVTQAQDNSLEWITIPAGNFIMGSTPAEVAAALADCQAQENDCLPWRFEAETPQQAVFVEAFEITRLEITHAQYRTCVAAGVCQPAQTDLPDSPIPANSDFFGETRPVVGVTITDASTFCQWVGGDLPSRAEWEKAARGQDGRLYPWGQQFDPVKANVSTNGPSPVGAYPAGASPYGLLDMAGNVAEWTADDVRAAGNMPPSLVVRGGSWQSPAFEARAAYLGRSLSPATRAYDLGFRCARASQPAYALVQQTEPIEAELIYQDGLLAWSIYNARQAYIYCYYPLGRSGTGWTVETEAKGSAQPPKDVNGCNLAVTGYDGSTVYRLIFLQSQGNQPDCSGIPGDTFAALWQSQRQAFGCPVGEVTSIPQIAEQAFQGGIMVWRGDLNRVYVIFNSGEWLSGPWQWDNSQPDGVGLTPPAGLYEPKRGFGWVWRTFFGGPEGPLGWALQPEQGFANTGQIQSFERGFMLNIDGEKIYLLPNSQELISSQTMTDPPFNPDLNQETCAIELAPSLSEIWRKNRQALGCPTQPVITLPQMAEQVFQGGYLLWRSDTDQIYTIYHNGTWASEPIVLGPGQPLTGPSLPRPSDLFPPAPRFNRLWRSQLGQAKGPLGWALAEEQIYDNLGQVQVFERGLILKGKWARVYVLPDAHQVSPP